MPAVDLLTAGAASLDIRRDRNYGPAGGQARRRQMEDDHELAAEAGRQRIIQRPRLTRLLDESPSRILMLIAPAGYGKTTLARQWLAERSHGWYRGTSASADVAALAVGLAHAARAIVPGAGERMQERLRATGTPEEDVVPLAELLSEDLAAWPEDSWLALDDYQFACRSRFSERFVDLLCSLTSVRLLVTSRLRPSWATSRRLLYGEVHELGRTFLAMTDDEALEVLGEEAGGGRASGLVALAEGWPAVIGLAALTEGRKLPESTVPSTLYDYFAEELYQAASPDLQWQLSQLALVPSVSTSVGEAVLGPAADDALAAGLRLGFLTSPARGLYDTHPLLRTFLESKFREAPESETTPVTLKLGHALVDREQWDDAFDLIERFFSERLFLELIERALPEVLRDGRLPTLDRWVDFGLSRGVDAAVLNLAEAESSFRKGERTRGEMLALQATRRLSEENPLTVRAFLLAGVSAHLSNRHSQAAEHYAKARALSATDDDHWEALRGELMAAAVLERPDADQLLQALSGLNDGRVEREIALATVRFGYGTRFGIGAADPASLEVAAHLGTRVRNPILRASFLYLLAQALLFAARYTDALKVNSKVANLAKEERLPFLLPYISLIRARSELGLRNFSRALRLLDQTERITKASSDSYVRMETLLAKAHLYLAESLPETALEILEAMPSYSPPRGEFGEYLLAQALSMAELSQPSQARALVRQATGHTQALHVKALAPCVLAILALQEGAPDADSMAHQAYDVVRSTGDVNTFVCAYRTYPRLLQPALGDEEQKTWITAVLRNARDDQIASLIGLSLRKPRRALPDLLSPRETEVLDLLRQGLTNRQIAGALWISEATAKVHVRHIFEKLGVRTRVEAAMKAAALSDVPQATSANDPSE